MSATSYIEPVLGDLLARVSTDATMLALLGGPYVYERETVDVIEQVPGIYWSTPSGPLWLEAWERWLITWDTHAPTASLARQIEARLVALIDFTLGVTLGGRSCTSQMIEGGTTLGGSDRSTYRRVRQSRLEIVRLRATA